MTHRPTWPAYFMALADLVASRCTCVSGRRVGCVLVRDNHVLSTGYNGSPRGVNHPGVLLPSGECGGCEARLCLHAEANAIAAAARAGIGLKGASVFTTSKPCHQCAGLLVNAGVVDVVYRDDYENAPLTDTIFAVNGAGIRHIDLSDSIWGQQKLLDPALCSCC